MDRIAQKLSTETAALDLSNAIYVDFLWICNV